MRSLLTFCGESSPPTTLGAPGHPPRRASRRGMPDRRARRRGISMYLFLGSLPIIIGMCGLVIDMGSLYAHRAQAQRAADAVALAGALQSDGVDNLKAAPAAQQYAIFNGYTNGDARGTYVNVTVGANNTAAGITNNDVIVTVGRKETVYFAPILEGFLYLMRLNQPAAQFSRLVEATATARRYSPLPLGLGGPYGIADPNKSPANLSVFGPLAIYNNGDPWNTKYLQDGTENPRFSKPDPDGKARTGETDYALTITNNFKSDDGRVYVQLYDPDCYSPNGKDSFDELRPANPKIPGVSTANLPTTTEYILYKNGIEFARATYGADASTNEKWNNPPGFDFAPESGAKYTMKVRAISGASENGFVMRAGPKQGLTLDDTQWNDQFGDKNGSNQDSVAVRMSASDHLQMNFTKSGKTTFYIGNIPKTQAGKQIGIWHFDVDVGSQKITYTCDSLAGFSQEGYLPNPGDGKEFTDTFSLPANYNGGNWYATYVAGAQDTSSWQLIGSGGANGYVRLTK